MASIKTVGSISDFLNKKDEVKSGLKTIIGATTPAVVLTTPNYAFASGLDNTFGNIHGAIMNAFDAGVVMVIIFAGAAWALGHRGKAIEIIIGVCCGYLLARHAIDIRDFLKGI